MRNSVGVYYPNQDFNVDAPAFFVDRETARQWLREEAAWSIHHGRDIALTPELRDVIASVADAGELTNLLLEDRQQSQVMGEPVMRANAERERWAVRMTRSWNPRVAQAEHLTSLKRYQELRNAGH